VVLPTETKSADEATQETIFAEEISRNHLKVSFLLGNKTALLSNPNIQPPVTITGVWDLAMIGGELDYVKNQLMGKLGKKEIEPSLDDLVITRQGTDEYFSLLRCEAGAQKISYVSAIHMPESAFLVVRTDALLDFQRQLLIEESQPHNPVNHVSEPKNSHLLIIAALLELQGKAVTQARQARNQSAIMDIVLESYGDIRGLGKRTLQEIFSSANKAMKAERSAK
jgi:hypothetical protein